MTYKVDVEHAFKQVLIDTDGDKITVTDLDGEILAEHTRPAPGSPTSATADPADPARKPEVSPKS